MDSVYRRYLKSKSWQELRQQVLNRAGGRCENCGYQPWKPGTLQVHHRTYERVGHESMDDLIVLCPKCHMRLHGIHRQRKNRDKEGD